jgi:hypothetical protein
MISVDQNTASLRLLDSSIAFGSFRNDKRARRKRLRGGMAENVLCHSEMSERKASD